MQNLFLISIIVISVVVGHMIYTADKIRRAREFGRKLYKKNAYYALIAKLFVKDLPE